jgi:hypothetical protein
MPSENEPSSSLRGGCKGGIEMPNDKSTRIKGLFLIVDRKNDKGLAHWARELEERKIPAVILVDEYMVDNNCSLVKNISERGFEIGSSYNEQPFWNEVFDIQYEIMSRIQDKVQSCISKPMRIFGSKYFAYNEATLQVADTLGIEYILARGTAGAKALIYKPHEYQITIISVSNVPSMGMGTGSLCDWSLFSRGETPDVFRKILFGLTVDKMILVGQTHLSGVKVRWWNVYQDFLNANIVTWTPLGEFATNAIELPNTQIPVNREVRYVTPKPKIPLGQEPDYLFEEPQR